MLKRFLLSLGLLTLSVSAQASLLEVSAFGGYTSVGMKDLNDGIDALVTAGPPRSGVRMTNGYLAGLDIRTGLLIPVPFLELGPRVEYVGTNQAKVTEGSDHVQLDGRLINALLGLNLGVNLPMTGLGFGLGAYAGYGMGALTADSTGTFITDLPTGVYTGQGLVYELEGRLQYSPLPVLGFYAFGGMRFANLGNFKNAAGLAVPKAQGQAANLDFSGFTAGLGLNLDF